MMLQEAQDSLTSSSSSSTSEDNSRAASSDMENDGTPERFGEVGQMRKTATDKSMVQIRAPHSEVKRRVAAFMASKRMEVSDNNIREFCFDLPSSAQVDGEEQNSCARVDSVYVGHVGGSSHVRVTRVINTQGPQTQARYRDNGCPQAGRSSASSYKSSVEERLRNAEEHLNMTSDSKTDLFDRLKAVEENILFLSGLSPEYFESGKLPQPKRRKIAKSQPLPEDLSPIKLKTEYDNISEIDQRIHSLQEKLKEKVKNELP